MTKYVPVEALSDAQAMKRLRTLTNNLRDAQADLEDLLMGLHGDEERWERISYAQLAASMGVSRQAVQQRVGRLLASGQRRRAHLATDDPNQLMMELDSL